MCGIVGLISKNGSFWSSHLELFTNMLRMDTIRGEDSTGVFGVTKDGHCDVVKGDADGYLFTRTGNYDDFLTRMDKQYRVVIGHNRAATRGSVTPENAHPFRERHIVLVHNGTINNKDTLNKDVEVDSHAIAHALADQDPVKALSKIDGAYALVWFDSNQRTLNLARNNLRPLYILEYDSFWAISSEAGLPMWLNSRENRTHKAIGLVPEEKILVMKIDQIGKGWHEVPYEEYKYWKAPTIPVFHSATGGNHTTVPFPKRDVVNVGGSNVTDLTATKSKNNGMIKAGDSIVFIPKDSKLEDGAEVLIGHPLFDNNEVDENIVIRAVMPRGTTMEDMMKLMDVPKFEAMVQAYRIMGGIPVAFVKEVKPFVEVMDNANHPSNKIELEEAIKEGCGKCKSIISIDEVKKGIARKKSDGTWRLVCPKCLDATLEATRASKPDTKLRLRTQ